VSQEEYQAGRKIDQKFKRLFRLPKNIERQFNAAIPKTLQFLDNYIQEFPQRITSYILRIRGIYSPIFELQIFFYFVMLEVEDLPSIEKWILNSKEKIAHLQES